MLRVALMLGCVIWILVAVGCQGTPRPADSPRSLQVATAEDPPSQSPAPDDTASPHSSTQVVATPLPPPDQATRDDLQRCNRDDDCIIVTTWFCDQETRMGINRIYGEAYRARPEWQRTSTNDCHLYGMMSPKTHLTRAICSPSTLRCELAP